MAAGTVFPAMPDSPSATRADAARARFRGKHRILGSAILVHAFLTSGAVLTVAEGWAGALNSGLWLCYALGGFGFLRGRRWGRGLTLIAAGGALATGLVLPAGIALYYYSTLWGLYGVPALVVLVSALLVETPPAAESAGGPPTGAPEGKRARKRTLLDIAHVSFMVLGLISAWAAHVVHDTLADDVYAALGFLVFVPCGIPLLLALALGPGLSFVLWRNPRLMALTVLSIALLVVAGTTRLSQSLLDHGAWPVLLALHAAACTLVGLHWFVKGRGRFG